MFSFRKYYFTLFGSLGSVLKVPQHALCFDIEAYGRLDSVPQELCQ